MYIYAVSGIWTSEAILNFEIDYKIEDNNLAVYKDDNPYVIRIIAKKL